MQSEPSSSTQTIIESLHEYERAVLPVLLTTTDLNSIKEHTKMDDIKVTRAFQWLSNKSLIEMKYHKYDVVNLDSNGIAARDRGLPEERFIEALKKMDGDYHPLHSVQDAANLSPQEAGASLGLLKGAKIIETQTTSEGLKVRLLAKEHVTLDANKKIFLKLPFPILREELSTEQEAMLSEFSKRPKFILIEKKQTPVVSLTELGRQIAKSDLQSGQFIGTLSSQMIRTKEYVGKRFRSYDAASPVPQISGGRIHPMTAIIRQIRQIFLEMGFSEMRGPWVESAFWCMDSMWIPQDHPARDVQDTFFLNAQGDLPRDELVKKVIKVHEKGARSGFKGYDYKWDPKTAAQLILRTHTTATTYRTFATGAGIKSPAKYFCIDRVFRNEAIDATHLPEFHQVEGFVMAPGLTLADLMGFIKEFYAKLGYTNIKFKPTYNPYTESSVEAFYFDERRGKWMELINSGIFRPESLEPYGIKEPVIAWGMGLERLAMIMLQAQKLKDIIGPATDLGWMGSYKTPGLRAASTVTNHVNKKEEQ